MLWFFVSFRNFFSDNTRVRIFFFVTQSANFFLQNLTLGHMTKTLNQIIFFFLHQNHNIFFSNIGNQNFFLKKTITPPLQVKWSFPYHSLGYYLVFYDLPIYYVCILHLVSEDGLLVMLSV